VVVWGSHALGDDSAKGCICACCQGFKRILLFRLDGGGGWGEVVVAIRTWEEGAGW
jgi:hypothetical protein